MYSKPLDIWICSLKEGTRDMAAMFVCCAIFGCHLYIVLEKTVSLQEITNETTWEVSVEASGTPPFTEQGEEDDSLKC